MSFEKKSRDFGKEEHLKRDLKRGISSILVNGQFNTNISKRDIVWSYLKDECFEYVFQ